MDTASDWTAIAADIAIDEYVDAARTDLAAGYRPPLTILMISTGETEPVVDRIVARPAYPGTDTARAITDLGDLLAARSPDTIVICREHQSLTTALDPNTTPPQEAAIVALTAGSSSAVSVFSAEAGARRRNNQGIGLTTASIPPPIADLLRQWRKPHCGNTHTITTDLETRGYTVSIHIG